MSFDAGEKDAFAAKDMWKIFGVTEVAYAW
jgi:hypothetical protein